ncbi:TolC family protein, partial [Vibrio parahaemolyticus]
SFGSSRTPRTRVFPSNEATTAQLTSSATWEIDFWGKYRSATAAARATLLSTEWARRQVVVTLISQLASAYFT